MDVNDLILRAERLLARLETLLPAQPGPVDWDASIGFRWRRKGSHGAIERPSRMWRGGVPPKYSMKVGARSIASTSASQTVPRVASADGEGSTTIIGALTETS